MQATIDELTKKRTDEKREEKWKNSHVLMDFVVVVVVIIIVWLANRLNFNFFHNTKHTFSSPIVCILTTILKATSNTNNDDNSLNVCAIKNEKYE
jgi:hypothetical protein